MGQYTIYSSSDASGPGLLTGQAGTVIALLKACLVDGYSGKAAAGWTQPVATAGNIGSFKNGTGSTGLAFVLNDAAPNGTPSYKEAWATGWESVAGVGSPVGTGSGQFPTAAQLLTSGHVVVRKSFSADGVGRSWLLFADAHSANLYVLAGDVANVYENFTFGDIFSLKTTADNYRCLIIGNNQENQTTAHVYDQQSMANAACSGHFMARSYGGGGTSILVGKHGDIAKSADTTHFSGILQTPNGPDSAYYLSPIWITESVGAIVRGRLRGIYQLCHPKASFADGQTISGSGDFAGKTFQIVRDVQGPSGGYSAPFAIETSNTLETN